MIRCEVQRITAVEARALIWTVNVPEVVDLNKAVHDQPL